MIDWKSIIKKLKSWKLKKDSRFSYGEYIIPFPLGTKYKIEADSIAHTGTEQNAIDYLVPEGTIVIAPRKGVILEVVDQFSEGGPHRFYADYSNYIIIDHGEGETSILIHLQKESSLVKVGQVVNIGQPIAKQGSTGWTYEPHIHFAVYRNRQTKIIRFDNFYYVK